MGIKDRLKMSDLSAIIHEIKHTHRFNTSPFNALISRLNSSSAGPIDGECPLKNPAALDGAWNGMYIWVLI